MKALTIWQPWASLIANGSKKIETRSWKTNYRGPIAIHAAKNIDTPRCVWEEPFKSELTKAGMMTEYPGGKFGFSLRNNGKVIAIADLVDCMQIVYHPGTNIDIAKRIEIGAESMTTDKHSPDFGKYVVPTAEEIAFGDWTPGRYAWILENVRMIEPVPAKGMQRIWNWEGGND